MLKRLSVAGLVIMGWSALAIGASTAAAGWYVVSQDILTLHRQPATAQVSYGADPLEYGLLRVPAGVGPHPVAIVIHGGCWLASLATVQNTEPLADALRDQGFATWNIEYRSNDIAGGGFPGTFTDIGQAVDYIRHLEKPYHLDLSRVAVIGHSAGGQLALWAAARHKLPKTSALYVPDPLPLRGVVVMGGVTDLKLAKDPAAAVCGANVVGQLLGVPKGPIPAARYQETSPIDSLPLSVPQVLIYGQADHIVPIAMGRHYQAAAEKAGDHVMLKEIPYAAHQEYLMPNSVVWPTLVAALRRLTSPRL